MSASSVEEAVKVVDQVLMDTLDMDPDIGDADIVLDALSAMPLASRLALARALVPECEFLLSAYAELLTAAEEPPHGP